MNCPLTPLPPLSKISHHGFAALYQHTLTGEKSLHATFDCSRGKVITAFEPAQILDKPHRYTVQADENVHILPDPGVLQFMNHSCRPNTFFDTGTLLISALRDIRKGDELTFFYPSTEWNMDAPFNCFCGEKECLHRIQGAAFLPREIIGRYRFTDFISQKLKTFNLQAV